MPTSKKSMTIPKKTPEVAQVRDSFETPRYAIELLIPFIPKDVKRIWECAAGGRRITRVLENAGYSVFSTDLIDEIPTNFLTWDSKDMYVTYDCIITNPPFSVKREFIDRAFEYKVLFAFLINADYSGEQIEWIRRGCEKIVPTRRINYLTPNILDRVHQGELVKLLPTLSKEEYYAEDPREKYKDYYRYSTIDEVPQSLLHRHSSSQFHSMWLTWGFNLGKTETFVDLPIQQIKENII